MKEMRGKSAEGENSATDGGEKHEKCDKNVGDTQMKKEGKNYI